MLSVRRAQDPKPIGLFSHGQSMPTSPAVQPTRAEQPQRRQHDRRREHDAEDLDRPMSWRVEPVHHLVVALAWRSASSRRAQSNSVARIPRPDEHDRPARARDTGSRGCRRPSTARPTTADHDAVDEVGVAPLAQPVAPARPSAPHAARPFLRRPVSRLARPAVSRTARGLRPARLPVQQPARDEDLAVLDAVDAGVDLQLLLDGRDRCGSRRAGTRCAGQRLPLRVNAVYPSSPSNSCATAPPCAAPLRPRWKRRNSRVPSMRPSSVLCRSSGMASMLPRLGRSIRRPGRRGPLVGVVGRQQRVTFSTRSAASVITSSGASAARAWSCSVRTASTNRP